MSEFPKSPRKGVIVVADDPDERIENGVVIQTGTSCSHYDFPVIAVHKDDVLEFAPGDRVILDDPNVCGDWNHRRMFDGIIYRFVELRHVIAVVE